MERKVLVTGGAGYLGSILVPALLSNGMKVTVLDNFMWGQSSLAECCADDNFSIIRGDVRDPSTITKAMADADYIIPLAALVGAPLCNGDKLAAKSVNTDAIKLICEIASKEQRILLPTTNSGYGIGQKDKFCTEETPLNPISLYGITKNDAEKFVLDRGNSISFRLATVFGMSPRMRIDLMVNDFVYRAVNDRFIVLFEGHFKRNFIHVRDVARAFLHAINSFDSIKNNAYNIGLSSANLSKIELCAKIKEHITDFVYLEAPIGEDSDKRDYIVSNDKIERTGYHPQYTLDMGIHELIKGYKIIRNSRYGNV